MTPPTPKPHGGTTLAERYQRAKTALAKADLFYTSELFWKAYEEGMAEHGGLTEHNVAKVEQMLRGYQRPSTQQPEPQASGAADPIDVLLEKYDTGEIETVQDLADEAEALATETDNELLMDTVQAFRRFQQEDWALAGRGDWDEAEAALIAGMKRARSA